MVANKARRSRTFRERCEGFLRRVDISINRTDDLMKFVLKEIEKTRPKTNGNIKLRSIAFLDHLFARFKDHASEEDIQRTVEFVLSEIGRKGELAGDASLPLVIYFVKKEDREAFLELIRAANPNMIARDV